MTLTENVKEEARKTSFKAVGISNLDGLSDLHYGKTDYVGVLKLPVRAPRCLVSCNPSITNSL